MRSTVRNLLRATFVAALSMTAATWADESGGQGACKGAEYRQFDFLVGDWEVFGVDNKKVGENRIELILAGCALQENWQSSGPSRGRSLNMYDQGTKRWHQTWVDNGGLLLRLDGGLDDEGRMVLSGSGFDPRGKAFLSRISWQSEGDHVRQIWKVSGDNGKSWNVLFEGLYKPKSKQK